ncbi:MAG: HAD family hydrolase [Persicimonas sp.]
MTTDDTTDRLLVCDVCDTLYRSNTTADFVRYVVERRGSVWRRAAYAAVMRRWSPVFLGSAVLYKAARVDVGRRLLIGLLRGFEREELEELGASFVDEVLGARRVEETHRRVEEALERGDRVLLASASVDAVVDAVAEKLGVEAVSSQLDYDDDGRCTGRLAFYAKGRKLAPVRERLEDGMQLTVMTDNVSDRGLLEAAHEPIVVLRRPEHRSRWEGLEAEFIST